MLVRADLPSALIPGLIYKYVSPGLIYTNRVHSRADLPHQLIPRAGLQICFSPGAPGLRLPNTRFTLIPGDLPNVLKSWADLQT